MLAAQSWPSERCDLKRSLAASPSLLQPYPIPAGNASSRSASPEHSDLSSGDASLAPIQLGPLRFVVSRRLAHVVTRRVLVV